MKYFVGARAEIVIYCVMIDAARRGEPVFSVRGCVFVIFVQSVRENARYYSIHFHIWKNSFPISFESAAKIIIFILASSGRFIA